MRLSIVEYGIGVPLTDITCAGYDLDYILEKIDQLNDKITKTIGYNDSFVYVKNSCLCASKIAGVISLDTDIDLEIIPKFLEKNSTSDWKSTLYFLSLISKHGFVFDTDYISSGSIIQTAFYDISGRILAGEYASHSRKPIRIYERFNFKSFTIDGELIFESFLDHDPDGFEQYLNQLSVHNGYNDVIIEAMRKVVPYVLDSKTKNILRRAIESYGDYRYQKRPRKGLPNNNREWKEAYSLSCDILDGFANALESGTYHSPSFIVNTWQIWEWLLTTGFRIGLHCPIKSQESIGWGIKIVEGSRQTISVNPDITLYPSRGSTSPAIIMDAKYKRYSSEITRQDLYEVMAFCQCTNCKCAFVLYPDYTENDNLPGHLFLQSQYDVGDVTVYAMTVVFGNIFSNEDFRSFGYNLSTNLLNFLKNQNKESLLDPQ